MPVLERHDHAVGCETGSAVERIGGEARFGLLPVGDDRRPGGFETPDRVEERTGQDLLEALGGKLPGLAVAPGGDDLGRPWDAANRFGRYDHDCLRG
jgi:hypothetical protein